MNKTLLIRAISETLRRNFENLQESSRKTRSEGNDAESKSEGKYDTRSIEENYLADGFAMQARNAAQALAAFEGLPLRSFDAVTPVDISALVLIGFPDEQVWFFIAPTAGGTEICFEGRMISILTPESPLGSQLIGLKVGDRIRAPLSSILAVE
jgi:hypothetical protein